MKPTVLVVTTVHHPDDTRIRERLIRTLSEGFTVRYAARTPGPTDRSDLEYVDLGGSRARRNLSAVRALSTGDWDIAVVHDPELIPAAAMARAVRRRPIVFDVHEDLPSQVMSKQWIPRPFRPLARGLSRLLYRLAESTLYLTLAESGYQRLFRGPHVTFPNYPAVEAWPTPVEVGDGRAVYLGDVTIERGVSDAVAACGRAGVALDVIGRADDGVVARLRQTAEMEGCDLTFAGRLPNPEALARVVEASVGLSPLRSHSNYTDSLPTKTLEYLLLGVPVVATDLPGTRRAIGGLGGVTLVEPGNIDAMAAAISRSAEPGPKREAVSGVEDLRSDFRWPAEKVLSFYESLLYP